MATTANRRLNPENIRRFGTDRLGELLAGPDVGALNRLQKALRAEFPAIGQTDPVVLEMSHGVFQFQGLHVKPGQVGSLHFGHGHLVPSRGPRLQVLQEREQVCGSPSRARRMPNT